MIEKTLGPGGKLIINLFKIRTGKPVLV